MTRRPLSPEAEAALNAVLRRAAERLERRNKPEEAEALKGVLAALHEQPRDE
jgi:hypothetical protein